MKPKINDRILIKKDSIIHTDNPVKGVWNDTYRNDQDVWVRVSALFTGLDGVSYIVWRMNGDGYTYWQEIEE